MGSRVCRAIRRARGAVRVEVLAGPGADAPEPGDVVTVVGVSDFLVIDADEIWANNATKKIRMTLKKWVA